MRIGNGIDVHAFGPGDHVMLGGVRIPHAAGLVAHSDGDVVLHALADALLGAIAAGDIGQLFPDTDPAWRGADSRELLRRVAHEVARQGYRVVNCDVTVLAQAPKLAPHREAMRRNIAMDLGIEMGCVSVKASTTERLGFVGRAEGIAAQAVVLVEPSGQAPA
jgi:2-C-methyl-D-erythritol 2,4-cyclodiphosphate synthase